MFKKVIILIGVVAVCLLENIGHYFGFCFHGWLSSIIASISVCGLGFILYLKQFQTWLMTRNPEKVSHKCNNKHHKHKETQ